MECIDSFHYLASKSSVKKQHLTVIYIDITVARRTAVGAGDASGIENMYSAVFAVNESFDRLMGMTEQRQAASVFQRFFD